MGVVPGKMYFGIVGSRWSILGKYIGNVKVEGSIHGRDSSFNFRLYDIWHMASWICPELEASSLRTIARLIS